MVILPESVSFGLELLFSEVSRSASNGDQSSRTPMKVTKNYTRASRKVKVMRTPRRTLAILHIMQMNNLRSLRETTCMYQDPESVPPHRLGSCIHALRGALTAREPARLAIAVSGI